MPRMQLNSNSTLHHLLRQCTNHRFGYLVVRFEASRLSSGHSTLSSPWLIASSLIGLQPREQCELLRILALSGGTSSVSTSISGPLLANYGPTAILSSTTAAASALIC